MAAAAKVVVATGATSGIGFEVIKQLLEQTQPYRFILGARDVTRTKAAYEDIKYDSSKHSLTILPLELHDLKTVKTFANLALENLGPAKLDYLFLNAATTGFNKEARGPNGSKWCEVAVVNYLAPHYLTHLLRGKLVESRSRLVVVSSGGVRMIKEPSAVESMNTAGTNTDPMKLYMASKFAQLLTTHWWRRELAGVCAVLAVSPGMVPSTGLGRGSGTTIPDNVPDAVTIPKGAASLIAAFTRSDFPEDPDQIFLTSWGEWWPAEEIKLTLDKELQEKFSTSLEQIEKEEGLA